MELYILDSLLRRTAVIDRFESLIWTERYTAYGDFQLVIFSTLESRAILTAGTRLAMSDSYRIMTIEDIENKVDSEGRQLLTVTGRSLEAILEDRVARNSFANLSTNPKWKIAGLPANIARYIFDQTVRTPTLMANDEIPFLQPGNYFPTPNIAEPDTAIQVELELMTVYQALKELGEAWDFGFRLLRNFDESELFFEIYTGNDRTTLQNTLNPVIFSPDLDNLTNTSELTSISSYKNVAYVYHPVGVQLVTVDGVSVDVEGFERRVLLVDASDITTPERPYELSTNQSSALTAALDVNPVPLAFDQFRDAIKVLQNKGRLSSAQHSQIGGMLLDSASSSLSAGQKTDINAAKDTSWAYNATEDAYINPLLVQRGKDELAKNRSLSAFDGELSQTSGYIYEKDYQLGDLVEMRNSDGVTNQMRVTEQIFVSDNEGERAYPTLTIDLFITPGSWFAWDYNQVWQDADGTWSEA